MTEEEWPEEVYVIEALVRVKATHVAEALFVAASQLMFDAMGQMDDQDLDDAQARVLAHKDDSLANNTPPEMFLPDSMVECMTDEMFRGRRTQ